MDQNVLQRVLQNPEILDADKKAFERFYNESNKIQFGRIGRNQEGYIYDNYKNPRCTAVLQMDGSKAGALMEWAKRQVSQKIQTLLWDVAKKRQELTEALIADICMEGLADPDKQRDDAADTGTDIHDEIEKYLIGGCKESDLSKYSEAVLRFADAWKRAGLVLVCTEAPVVWIDRSTGRGFGGRLDILAYKQGRFYIGDNKTSRSVHESYGLQIGAYKAAVEQMSQGAIKIAGGFIFHIPNLATLNERQKKEYDKRGSLIELKDLEDAFEHYRLLLELYYKRNNKYF